MLRVVFMGADGIALPLLDWLAGAGSQVARVVAVFTQPDRASGRGQKIQEGPVKAWALSRGIPVHQPARLEAADLETLRASGADLALVMAYGHILRDEFIAAPRLGTLNLHTSLLPKFRGASPIQTAVACGETMTGVTLMRIVAELDAGPVADRESVPIGPLDTAADVEARVAAACVPLVARALPRIADGSQQFFPQDAGAATFCRRLEKEDGRLDFSAPAAVLAARINGLFPWPGCGVEMGREMVRIGQADALPDSGAGAKAGAVLGQDESGLLVATGAGVLRLRRLQRPGGRMLAAGEFLRGRAVGPGAVLPSSAMSPLVGKVPFPRKRS